MNIEILSSPEARKYAESCALIHRNAFCSTGTRSWTVEEFSNLLDRKTILLLRTDLAFLLVDIIMDEAEIITFAVQFNKKRQGLGRALLKSFFDECTCRKVNNCTLEVAEDNVAAIRIYELCNFEIISIRNRYFKRKDGYVSALVMKKSFAGG